MAERLADNLGRTERSSHTSGTSSGVRAQRASLGGRLSREFYSRPVLEVARDCIGRTLVRRAEKGLIAGTIVEAEAYRGPEDRAAHSFGGRRTARTEVMFGPPGYAYVFLIYGMHWHFNIVVGRPGSPHAVLIRAVEPLVGRELMELGRPGRKGRDLASGPGKLCGAFGITGTDYGVDLCTSEELYLSAGSGPKRRVKRSPRIGVDYAGAWAARPWRFFDAESLHVSRARSRSPS